MADDDEIVKEDEGADDDPFMLALKETDIDPDLLKPPGEEEQAEGKAKEGQEINEELTTLKGRLEKLEGDKKNLQTALHEARQVKKAAKADDTAGAVLSDADLAKIIEEHKDDPAVLLNAVTYKMNHLAKGMKAEAVDEVEVKGKQERFNNVLRERYGDALDDDSSPIRTSINKAKAYLGLEDHPYGEALSAAAATFAALPQLLAQAKETGRKEALDGKIEARRVDTIKGNQNTPAGRKNDEPVDKKTGLTEDQMDTAKRLGFKPGSPQMKIYLSQIRKAAA